MAERKSVNKYYPPDWDPSKGSVNKHVGQHPLRDRARKLSQGILVIRFEMPYNIWCEGCNNPIGMGVRYNAEKKKVGNYYTTPIYKFRMKCHLCDNHFEIQTDPKNHDYVIVLGARRKEQRWDAKDNEQIETEDKATQKRLATDAMYKLEHGSDDQQKRKAAIPNLGQIEDRMSRYKDDYILNKLARNKFRTEKKSIKTEQESDKALLEKSSLDIALVKESEDDIRLAGLLRYRATESFDEKQVQKRKEIESRPLFATPKAVGNSPSSSTALSQEKNSLPKKRLGLTLSSSKPSLFGGKPTVSKSSNVGTEFGIRRKSNETNSSLSGQQPVPGLGETDSEIFAHPPEIIYGNSDEKIQTSSVTGVSLRSSRRNISSTGIPVFSTSENQKNALNSLISEYADSDSSNSD